LEDVSWHDIGAERDVVAAVVPVVVVPREEIFDFKVLVVRNGELFQI